MAIIQCPECRKEISSTAPTCPGCGYALKPAAVKIKKGGIGCGGWLIVLIVLLIIIWIIGAVGEKLDEAKMTPERKAEIEAAQKIKAERVSKFGKEGSVGMVHYYLTGIMKDPDSLELNCGETFYNKKDGWLIKCDWRGKNSFGGYARKVNWFVIRNEQVVKMENENTY
ncbi:MAG: hypothetical protein CVV49_08480 [Spirochaetae bacterium HGW-Spirochaetae-5]|nr:MAG: hypothetical protein CVV49_08480 [Spirochaetae bacterium HGW-Spirochaetae-5]